MTIIPLLQLSCHCESCALKGNGDVQIRRARMQYYFLDLIAE